MTQGDLEKLPVEVEKAMQGLERRIMEDIVRRIQINGFSTASADWQITRLQQLGMSFDDVKKWVQDSLDVSDREIEQIFSDGAYRFYMDQNRGYSLQGLTQIPFEENAELQHFANAAMLQTKQTMRNLTSSLGFVTKDGALGKVRSVSLSDYYTQTLDNAIMDIQSGAFSYNEVINRTINDMTRSGLRWIDYESGHHNRVPVAARRAVMTGFRQVQGYINEQTAAALHTDSFEVTVHIGARPSHAEWEGKVYTKEELHSICGLGEVTGLHGANCYHDYNPFIPGVSIRTYTDEQLDQIHEAEATKRTYNGKEYDTYQALQHQRQMETAMRATRQKIHLSEIGAADDEDITSLRARYKTQMSIYKDFAEKMELPTQVERITQDGLKIKDVSASERGISNKKLKRISNYAVDWDVVNTNEYKRKFNGITGIAKVDEAIHKYAKAALTHRDGTDREDLYILSAKDGRILGSNLSCNESKGVGPNESVRKAVRENIGQTIGLHNHPDDTPPTGSDFAAAFARRYVKGVVVCSDGTVYEYSTGNQYVTRTYIDTRIKKYQELIDDHGRKVYNSPIEAHLAALDSLREDGVIWYEARR